MGRPNPARRSHELSSEVLRLLSPYVTEAAALVETKNTVRYAEEAEDRRPVVGTVYIDKYELTMPFPEKIRVTIEPAE